MSILIHFSRFQLVRLTCRDCNVVVGRLLINFEFLIPRETRPCRTVLSTLPTTQLLINLSLGLNGSLSAAPDRTDVLAYLSIYVPTNLTESELSLSII